MDGIFVEVQVRGQVLLAIDVPVLDCVRIPGAFKGSMPQAANWLPDGAGRWAAHYDAVIGTPDDFRIERVELKARRHT